MLIKINDERLMRWDNLLKASTQLHLRCFDAEEYCRDKTNEQNYWSVVKQQPFNKRSGLLVEVYYIGDDWRVIVEIRGQDYVPCLRSQYAFRYPYDAFSANGDQGTTRNFLDIKDRDRCYI
jgi:hypothetical protein